MEETKETQAETTALIKAPPVAQLEQIERTDGRKRTLARNTTTGKFMRRNEAVGMQLARDAQEFANAKSEQDATLTNAELLRKHLLETALKCTSEKSLIGLAKIYETLIEEATGARQVLEEAIKSANTEKLNPVQIVFITPPALMNPEIHEEKPSAADKTRPSWCEAEVIHQNGPHGTAKK